MLRSSRTHQRRFAPIAMTEPGDRHAPVSVIAMAELRTVVHALPSMELIWSLDLPTGLTAHKIALAGDGRAIAVAGQEQLYVWRVGQSVPLLTGSGLDVWLSPMGDLALVRGSRVDNYAMSLRLVSTGAVVSSVTTNGFRRSSLEQPGRSCLDRPSR